MAKFIASGFGSGLVAFAPGTFGSLVALLLAWGMYLYGGVMTIWIAFLLLVPIAFFAGIESLTVSENKDPSWIVIDEWLGQWLSLMVVSLFFPLDFALFAGSFVCFRLLDIFKPWPISWAEQCGPAWWTIHADDLLAGLIAGLGLVLIYSLL